MIALPVLLVALAASPLFTSHAEPNSTTAATESAATPASSATALPSAPLATTPPAPAPTPATGSTPSSEPSPAAGAVPAIVPADATYQYRFIPSQPKVVAAGQPQIFAVYLNAKKLHSLGPIAIRVLTSANVVKVTTSSNGREGVVPKIATGDFEAKNKLPKLPFVASGITTTIDFVATTAAGKKVTVGVPVALQ